MEETPDRTGNSGMSGLKVVFSFPLLPEEDIIKVVVDFFLFKRGGEAGKKGFQPMKKKLGEKFGVVFSFAVVVTDTELWLLTSFSVKEGVKPGKRGFQPMRKKLGGKFDVVFSLLWL